MYLHRFLMDATEDMQVDHINHDTLDNRSCNLRLLTNAENAQNRNGAYSSNKSTGVRGVSWNKKLKKYETHITLNYKKYKFGYFDNLDDAKKAVEKAREELMTYAQ